MNRLKKFDIRRNTPLLSAIAAAWLAVALGFALLVNLPRSERAAAMKNALDSFARLATTRERKVDRLRAQYQRVIDGERTLETFYRDVLSTKRERMPAFQRELRSIAQKFNINPETITYTREIFENDQIVKFAASLPLTGSYENLRAFIDAVERSEHFITIQYIQLTDSKEGGVILSLTINVATYFFDMDIVPKKATGRKA